VSTASDHALVYLPSLPNTGDCVVFLRHRFAAPRSLVWRFFSEGELLARWFGPTGVHVDPESVVVGVRPGGRWDLDMVVDEGGARAPIRAEVVVARAPEYLEARMESRPPGDEPAGLGESGEEPEPIMIRIWLHEVDGGTLLTLHQGPFGPGFRDVTAEGWESSFDKIDRLLAASTTSEKGRPA
jgi:uncharacterized protein YndB with AHSA1/START domain